MLITVGCPTCGHRYDIAGKLAGKKVRCNECANTFRVPVPTTMPAPVKKSRKPKPEPVKEGIEGSIGDILGVSSGQLAVQPTAMVSPQSLLPDLGERWSYRGFQLLCFVVLGIGSAVSLFAPITVTMWFCFLMGLFLLLPVLAGWDSLETSRIHRILSHLCGPDIAKATLATFAVSFWIFAILIGTDAIHIASLQPDPGVKAEARSEPDSK